MELRQIQINEIKPNPFQPREKFNKEQLQELADNIKQHGMIEPIVVTRKGGSFIIVAGERRWRANKLAKQDKVYALIKNYNSESDIKRDSLVENELRENLTTEEFKAFNYSLAKSLGFPYYDKGWINCKELTCYVLGLDSNTRAYNSTTYYQKLSKVFAVEKKATTKVKKYLSQGKLDLDTASRISSLDKDTQNKIIEVVKDKSFEEKRREVARHNFQQQQKVVHEKLKKEKSPEKKSASEEMWLSKIESKVDGWDDTINFASSTLHVANNKSFWKNFSHESRMDALDNLKPFRRDVEKLLHIVTKIMETIGGIEK